MWKYRTWSVAAKAVATVLSLAFFVSSMSNKPRQEMASSGASTAQQAPVGRASKPATRVAKAPKAAVATRPVKESNESAKAEGVAEEAMASNVSVQKIDGVGKREVGMVDSVAYVVVKAERMQSIGDTRADGTFIVLRMAANNTDKKTHDINTSLMKPLDDRGREFDPSSQGGMALVMSGDQTAEVMMAQVQPDTVKQFSLVFDGPDNAKGLKLKIPAGSFSMSPDAVIKVP
jgi:hypothetical protein